MGELQLKLFDYFYKDPISLGEYTEYKNKFNNINWSMRSETLNYFAERKI